MYICMWYIVYRHVYSSYFTLHLYIYIYNPLLNNTQSFLLLANYQYSFVWKESANSIHLCLYSLVGEVECEWYPFVFLFIRDKRGVWMVIYPWRSLPKKISILSISFSTKWSLENEYKYVGIEESNELRKVIQPPNYRFFPFYLANLFLNFII